MKSGQLLSILFSLIMLTGVTAGSTVLADSEDLDKTAEEITSESRDVEDNSGTEDKTEDKLDGNIDDLDDRLEKFCEMNDEDKRQLFADHPRLKDFVDRLTKYCQMSEDERENAIDELIKDHFPEELERQQLRAHSDESNMNPEKDMRVMLDKYCTLSDEDKKMFVDEHDKTEDHVEKMNQYCALTDEIDRMDFIKEHRDEYVAHMKGQMMDKIHDFDEMSDMAETRMSDVAKDKLRENKVKMSEKSDRLKAMIIDKRDISDEKQDEIRTKYIEKHGDLNKKKSELKMKFNEHMKEMRIKISDERKASIHDRLAEMKAFKAELRERTSDMTDEEKQQLREDFIEKAKDIQLAWISPRTQITAGVDAGEVECREGYNLVIKMSNGLPMCLKTDTALKMIDRGITVPAN